MAKIVNNAAEQTAGQLKTLIFEQNLGPRAEIAGIIEQCKELVNLYDERQRTLHDAIDELMGFNNDVTAGFQVIKKEIESRISSMREARSPRPLTVVAGEEKLQVHPRDLDEERRRQVSA